MLESLRGRRSEEMTQSEVPFESQRGCYHLKSPEISRFLKEDRMEGKRSLFCYPSKNE